jgi:hypothetical protein
MASQFLARPFAALRPTADGAPDVIAPPYDVVSTDEARARGEPAAGQLAALLRQLSGEFFGIGINFVDRCLVAAGAGGIPDCGPGELARGRERDSS